MDEIQEETILEFIESLGSDSDEDIRDVMNEAGIECEAFNMNEVL